LLIGYPQDVVPYVFSDWLSFLIPSILSPTIYVICVYLIANLWHDDRAARLFTMVASVRAVHVSSSIAIWAYG
jgi:hypothetical protein